MIKDNIKQLLEDFIYDEINKMIINNQFKSIYKLDDITFGDYKIKVEYNSIRIGTRDVSFVFDDYDTSYYRKKFLSIPYGKNIKVKTFTRIGKIRELYYEKEKEYLKEIEYTSMINGLPDEYRKNITRKEKIKEVLDENNK